MPIADLYAQFKQFTKAWTDYGFNLTLLEQQILSLTLRSTPNQRELALAWERSFAHDLSRLPPITTPMVEFARRLYERFAQIWLDAPYNDPSLIIYSASVKMPRHYLDDSIVIEVDYRHALPTPQP
jgi:hypothetical protein